MITPEQIDAELARRPLLRLPFPPAIEARYEEDNNVARAWTIRLTVPLGLIAYVSFGFVDTDILPDLGWVPEALRVGVVMPIGLYAMWMCTRREAGFREAFISLAITITMMIPVGFIAVSRAPLAPYTMFVVLLVSNFGNIVMRMRFHWACFFSLMTMLSVGVMLALRPDLATGLSFHIWIATITGMTFGIVANNELERAERRAFLLGLREILRSEQLSADRAAFSALSLVDPLTGLANRRAFDARLAELWAQRTIDQPFSLIMIDVDFFKKYNDRYGHPTGDACLRQVAKALASIATRAQDVVARYGGEEFAVILPDCDLGVAITTAERMRQAVWAKGIAHDSRGDAKSFLTVSIGVASSADPAESMSAFLDNADRNLYAAKRAGRDRVEGDSHVVTRSTPSIDRPLSAS